MSYTPRWSPDGAHGSPSATRRAGSTWWPSRSRRAIRPGRRGAAGPGVATIPGRPHSRYLAFSLNDPNGFRFDLYLGSRRERLNRRSRDRCSTSSSRPGIPDGDYLFYMADRSSSRRRSAPSSGTTSWIGRAASTLIALRDDVPNPFPPQSDEVETDDGTRWAPMRGPRRKVPLKETEVGGRREGPLRSRQDGASDQDRLRRARRPRGPGSRRVRTTTRTSRVEGKYLLYRPHLARSTTAGSAGVTTAVKIFTLEDRKEDHPRRGRGRLRPVLRTGRRRWCASRADLQAVRREAQGQGREGRKRRPA